MMEKLKIAWISAGVSSFIAAYLVKETIDKFIYIDIADQHPDSIRFIKDCEKVFGKPIEILRATKYKDIDECVRGFGYFKIQRNGYAPCTNRMKKDVRKEWEEKHSDYDITYVWGFDLDEKDRKNRLEQAMQNFKHEFPLIDKQLAKQDAHAICEKLGIKRPVMYDLGYNNNNCIGCVKGGMGYWNKIRKDFPQVFDSRAKLERILSAKILKECYLDELNEERGRTSEEILQDCSIFCQLATAE